MSLINQEGFYHGTIVDGGLSQSTGGFPQEVLALQATEVYDPDNDEYLLADAENSEITAYLVLIDGKDRETLNTKQLKKIIDWNGASFVDLAGMDLAGVDIAFRVEARTYKENTTLQVTWVDTLDATPFRTVQKLTKEEATALQQRYAGVLASTKAAVKPASAPVKAPMTDDQAAAAKTQTATQTIAAAKAAKPKATKPKAAKPKAPKPPKATVGKCTADDAYNTCYSLKQDVITDDQLNELWLKAVAAVNEDESKITEEQWYGIKESLLKQISKV